MNVYAERVMPDIADPQDMEDDRRERSEYVADAANYWFEQGWDDFRPGQDIEEIVRHMAATGHPHLVRAYREGWELARKDEEGSDAKAPPSA